MIELRYANIEQQLVDALPELAPAAAYYWKKEGPPGSDCGPYIFFEDMFARYVQILVALPNSPRRDELLRRAFAFVERMLASTDANVRDLAFIGLFEGREGWLFARSRSFVGSVTSMVLDERWPTWRGLLDERVAQSGDTLLDGYHVRRVIAHELRDDGVTLDKVPGRTYAEDEHSA
jgi:hypothetical protein